MHACRSTLEDPTAFVLAGLHVSVHVAMREVGKDGAEVLTRPGRWVSTGLIVASILVLSFCLVRMASRVVDAWVAGDPARAPVGPTVKFAIKLIAVPLAILTAAEAGGAQLSGVLAALSVGSLALGLALQDFLKNIIAGIQIVLDRPIRPGDFVELDKVTRGTVIEVGLRSTKLRSPDNNTIIIPNGTIASAIVVNVDHTDRAILQAFEIAVAYGSDTRKVQRILEEVAAQAAKEVPTILEEPQPVSFRDFGESSVNFTVKLRMAQFIGRGPAVTEMYHRFHERLRAEGIRVAVPTRVVHLEDDRAVSAAASPPPSR